MDSKIEEENSKLFQPSINQKSREILQNSKRPYKKYCSFKGKNITYYQGIDPKKGGQEEEEGDQLFQQSLNSSTFREKREMKEKREQELKLKKQNSKKHDPM